MQLKLRKFNRSIPPTRFKTWLKTKKKLYLTFSKSEKIAKYKNIWPLYLNTRNKLISMETCVQNSMGVYFLRARVSCLKIFQDTINSNFNTNTCFLWRIKKFLICQCQICSRFNTHICKKFMFKKKWMANPILLQRKHKSKYMKRFVSHVRKSLPI